MITTYGMSRITADILALLDRGSYVKNGVATLVDVYSKEVIGNKVRVLLYLNEADAGNFTEIKIIDTTGAAIISKPSSVVKTAVQGMMVVFEIDVREVL